MKIGIVGIGVVGGALKKMFEAFEYTVIGYDKYKDEYKQNYQNLFDCEVLFLCLPTPTINDKISLEAFDDFFWNFTNYKGIIVIKSTILPGTCKMLSEKYNYDILHSPEFITEKNALIDTFTPNKIVIGSDVSLDKAVKISELFKPLNKEIIFCDTVTSELIKYACNCELAMQVSYANEIYEIAEKIGANYQTVKKAMLLDKRIGRFKEVTKERGFGGMCFPKDTQAFLNEFNSDMVKATVKINKRVKR